MVLEGGKGQTERGPMRVAIGMTTHLLVLHHPVLIKVNEEDVAGHQPPLARHISSRNINNTNLGRHDHTTCPHTREEGDSIRAHVVSSALAEGVVEGLVVIVMTMMAAVPECVM
jgi:hypothetical protein